MYNYTKILYVKRTTYIEVFVYYSRNGEKLRLSTRVKVLPIHFTKGGDISRSHPNYTEDIRKIDEIQSHLEYLVETYTAQHHEKPDVPWLENAYQKSASEARPSEPINSSDSNADVGKTIVAALVQDVVLTPPPTANVAPAAVGSSYSDTSFNADIPSQELDILCYWNDFIDQQSGIVRNKQSLNRLNNARYAFRRYKSKRNIDTPFSSLNQEFFNDYVKYMVEEHEYYRNKYQAKSSTAKPTIGLNNITTIKRLSDLKAYLKYCIVSKDINLKLDKIAYYIDVAKKRSGVRTIKKKQRWELILTVDEIEFVVNLDSYASDFWSTLSDNQKRYLDIMIFMCLQGTNPKDTQGIRRTDILGTNIIKDRTKNFNEYDVELDPISEAILKRNNYDLTFVEQTLNDELKRLFVTIFELYRPLYEQRTGEPYQMICLQRTKKGNRDVFRLAHRGLYIECTTGRRSYISNYSQLAGLRATMGKVGHKVESTTKGYTFGPQQGVKRRSVFGIQKRQADDDARISA